jgi:hypothetical protein
MRLHVLASCKADTLIIIRFVITLIIVMAQVYLEKPDTTVNHPASDPYTTSTVNILLCPFAVNI